MVMCDTLFKNRPSKFCGKRLFSTNFTWAILEYFVSYVMLTPTQNLLKQHGGVAADQ